MQQPGIGVSSTRSLSPTRQTSHNLLHPADSACRSACARVASVRCRRDGPGRGHGVGGLHRAADRAFPRPLEARARRPGALPVEPPSAARRAPHARRRLRHRPQPGAPARRAASASTTTPHSVRCAARAGCTAFTVEEFLAEPPAEPLFQATAGRAPGRAPAARARPPACCALPALPRAGRRRGADLPAGARLRLRPHPHGVRRPARARRAGGELGLRVERQYSFPLPRLAGQRVHLQRVRHRRRRR